MDGKEELSSSDYEVAEKLRRSRKPVLLAVNKIDNFSPDKLFDFYALGLGDPFPVSAEHSQGIGDLLDAAVEQFPQGEDEEEERLKVALVGKPNAGKSSLTNRLLGFERTIVTDIAGTTRDAIDTPFEFEGEKYTLIDTAGIRRKKNVTDDVEYYSVVRALDAVRRADVCLLVVDSGEGLTEQDVKIIGYVHEQGKPSVIVMNKWDLVEKDARTVNRFEEKLKEDLKFMDYYKSVYVSAKDGAADGEAAAPRARGVRAREFPRDDGHAQRPHPRRRARERARLVQRAAAEGVLRDAAVRLPAHLRPVLQRRAVLMHFSYKRYLENVLRRAFDFSGTPVRILARTRGEDAATDGESMKVVSFADVWYWFVVMAVVSYFVGCFNFALLISKIKHKDVRRMGSGNPGTMNMSRQFGLAIGGLTLFCDMVKGGLTLLIAYFIWRDYVFAGSGVLVSDLARYVCGVSVIIGHIYPVTMKFKGGKGIASTLGMYAFALCCETEYPWMAAVVFGILLLTLFYIWASEWGSMGSLLGVSLLAATQAIVFYIRYAEDLFNGAVIALFVLLLLDCFLTWFAHRKNILSLLAGEEHHTSVKKLSHGKRG